MKNKQVLLETILVTTITLLGLWFLPDMKAIIVLIPIAYLLIERRIRKRTWSDLGFKSQTFWMDLRVNWFWFALVGLVSQPAAALWAKNFFPAYLAHVQARLPFESGIGWGMLLPLLAVSLVGEELTYRTLIQGRLTAHTGIQMAVLLSSLLFGLAHLAPGPGLVVVVDVGLIIIDSILFGMIYARSGNLIVTWAAHLLGDVLGLLVIMSV